MKLYGNVYEDKGLIQSIRAMHLQSEIIGTINANIIGFDKIGYQRIEPVVSSFSEYLGVQGLSKVVDDTVGRIFTSNNPLDLAISEKGYFQYLTPDGIKLTRDGRFKIGKNGELLTLNDNKVLANDGTAISFKKVPEDFKDIKIEPSGLIKVFNKKTLQFDEIATLGVVTSDNIAVLEPNIQQGYSEHSNVQISSEFLNMLPVTRNFDANRKMFSIQSSRLRSAIEKLASS